MSLMGLLIFSFLTNILCGVCSPGDGGRSCSSGCSVTSELRYLQGMRYTYRYSTVTTSSRQSSASDSSGLALDCLLDIDVLPQCQLIMKLRNSQMKKVSLQRDNSAQRLKNLREALERSPLLFSLQDGKIAHVCPREGEATWALNIKRAILSMLQTSHTGEPQDTVKETDIYGTCTSRYERRGPALVKTRDLQRCLRDRLAGFWPHSVPLSLDNEQAMDSRVQCIQRHGNTAMEEVNCTETVRMTLLAGRPAAAFVQSMSTLSLLRVQEVVPMSPDTQVYTSDLQFEEEITGPGRAKPPELQDIADTVRKLCATKPDLQQNLIQRTEVLASLTSDGTVGIATKQVNQYLHLVFQLRTLSHQQLQDLWQEASFKCRDDWQPLVDSLPACGSEACVSLMTELLEGGELEPERVSTFLSSFGFIPHPTPNMLTVASALLRSPETRSGALLAVSTLVNTLCQRVTSPCSQMPQVQQLMEILKEILEDHSREEGHSEFTEKLRVLKAVGNAGLAAATLIPELAACAQNQSIPLELRLAAIQAFRRIPCSAERQALLRLYRSSQEDVEVRIAAYQQLMRCPERDVLRKVRATLRDETSSQVGSYVWSHLTQIQKTDDPLKQDLMEALPDDIISKEFEGESWKYSSYMDATMDTGFGATNVEGALVFSPSSFIPRSAMANLTIHILGRAFNLLEIDIRAENVEPILKELFGHKAPPSDGDSGPQTSVEASMREKRSSMPAEDAGRPEEQSEDGRCESAGSSRLRQAKAMFTGRQSSDGELRCGLSAKVFGNELAFVTCGDVRAQVKQMSLNLAEVAVKLMKGQEVQFHRRAVLATAELVLPSLSGWPIKMALNMSASLSLRVKGSTSLKSWSHFSISGYVKPSAYVGISARMGLEGICGRAGVEWSMGLRTSTSLDGGIQLQRGQDLKVSLNTPEEVMDIIHFSSRTYSISGESREEVKRSRDQMEKSTCTPQDWWKLLGWQLCSQVSYPSSPSGLVLPPAGPVQLSLRLVKLDKGLHQYLLEAAYALLQQRGTWFPKEASLHVFLGTPQSTVLRDLSLDLTFSSINQQLSLKVSHPLKTVHVQGKIDRVKSMRAVKMEVLVDNVHHYYIKGLTDVQALPTELRLLSHLEAKLSADGQPIVLSANLTRGLGRKISVAAMLKNVFREKASLSVLVEWRMDQGQKQHSLDAELLLPGLVGTQISGLIQNSASLWSSTMRLRYSLRELVVLADGSHDCKIYNEMQWKPVQWCPNPSAGDPRSLQKECHMTQAVRNKWEVNQAYHLTAEHEFHCSHTTSFNHKVLLKHEEASGQIQSSLDLSYGKHWDEINNKRRVLLSQSFKNESRHTLTSYLLEFSLQVLEKHLQYRTQLLHSHLRQNGVESSTHLKVNYNDQLPLVAGLHWRDYSRNRMWKWEGTFNMDTPWLYIYMAHKLSQPQRRALQFNTEVTARKWVTLRSLVLEGFYREKGREREGRLHLHTPTDTYLKASGWGLLGKQGLKASGALSSAWTPVLRGDLSLEGTRQRKALQLGSSYGRHNVSFSASLNTLDKRLRKRLVAIKMVLMEPQGAPVEFELEGGVEELKRSRELYQKQGTLRLRQPFLHLPQNLLLQEVFTVDLQRARYVLESRAVLGRSKECIHILTLGYQPARPFVCSTLSHPFSSEVIPHDSELCVTLHSNETQKEVQGTMRVNKKDRLLVLGRVWNVSDSLQQGYGLQVNFTHAFMLRIPPSMSLEGGLYWKPASDDMFDYLATGKTIIIPLEECQLSVQLNGSSSEFGLYSSLSHPYTSRIPRNVQAHARAELSAEGHVVSSVSMKTDGEERVTLEADLLNTLEGDTRLLGGQANLRQKLLPVLQDLQLQLSANVSEDRLSAACTAVRGGGTVRAQLSGAVGHGAGFGISFSGGLQHSLASLVAIPPALGMEGTLRQSDQLTEGRLTVMAGDVAYGLELSCRAGPESAGWGPMKGGMPAAEPDWEGVWLRMHAGGQSLSVNVSGSRGGPHGGGLHALLLHTSPRLSAKGIPFEATVRASWTWDERAVSMAAALQAGSQALQAELDGVRRGYGPSRWELSSRLQHHSATLLEKGVPASMGAIGHYEVGARSVSTGLTVHVHDQRRAHLHIEAGRTDDDARLAMSLGHDVRRLVGVLPGSFEMNCSGHAVVAQLSGRCSGAVAGFPIEVRASRQQGAPRCCLSLELSLARQSLRAGGCYGDRRSKELTVYASHSSAMLHSLGVPPGAQLRASFEPRAGSWRCSLSALANGWRAHLSGELRAAPVFGWKGLASYTGQGGLHSAQTRGTITVLRCHLSADVTATWNGVTTSLVALAHCWGLRVTCVQVQEGTRGGQITAVVLGRVGQNGVQMSLDLDRNQDSLHSQAILLVLENRTELDCTLWHHWGSLRNAVPLMLGLHGSARMDQASLSGNVHSTVGSRSAQFDVSTRWGPRTHAHARLRHNLSWLRAASIPDDMSLRLDLGRCRATAELTGERCAISARGALCGKTWELSVHQRGCPGLQTPLPRHFSMNGSLATSGPGLLLDALLDGGPGEKGELSLVMESAPQLRLQAAIWHSLPPLQLLGVPPRGTLALSAHSGGRPSALLELVLGLCEITARVRSEPSSGPGETGSSWAANWTNHCQALRDAGLPGSLELSGLVALSPCQSALSSSLHVDGEVLSLELGHACQPSHRFTGSLTHSISRLRRRGLPADNRLALLVPGGPGKNGTLLLKVGSCQVRASRGVGPVGKSQWVWATETECPLLEGLGLPAQAQFNGSLLLDGCAVEALLEVQVEGQCASLELQAQCHPGLRIEGVLQHSVPALGSLPRLGRLLVLGTAAPLRYDAQLALQLDLCALAVSGGLWRGSRLEGSLLLQNNCTTLRELGTPSRLKGSGSLAIGKEISDSHLSLVTDDRKLRALLTTKAAGNKLEVLALLNHSMPLLRVAGVPPTARLSFNSDRGHDSYHKTLSCILGSQQITEDLSIEKTEEGVRLMYCFNHSMASLRDFGIPKNNSIQAKLGFGEVRSLSVHSSLGAQLASLGAKLKDKAEGTEVTGSLQHSWRWLEERGLPKVVEALCSVQGYFPQLQSRMHLSVDEEMLLASTLNVSLIRSHLDLLFSLAAPRGLLPGFPQSLGTALTAHHQGSQKQVSLDAYCDDARVRVAGEMAGWGTGGREARAAVLHIGKGQDTPTLQVEAWGRLTDSQLRCSLAVNPKTNSSLAFMAHGHDVSSRKELNVRMQQNMPGLQDYLPSQLEAKAQLNHSGASMQGLAEVRVGSSELRAMGQLALLGAGCSQALELNHSFAQLRHIPRSMAVRMMYKGGNWTGSLQQEVVWGGHMFKVSGEYATPPEHEGGVYQLQVQVSNKFPSLSHECGLDVRFESSAHRRLDSVLLDWSGQERNEKVRVLCSWSSKEELWEGTVDVRQLFTQDLSHLHLHALSQSLAHGQGSSHQAQLSWNEGRPANVTLTVSRHLHGSSSRGQACLLLSPGQMQAVLPLMDIEGCGTMAREGNSYSQSAELKWGNKRITQVMKYQRGAKGIHTLQLEGGAENVSPLPCSSHTFLAQVHTNGQDQLEHHLLLGLCPPHPAWAVSGYHRVSTGRQLLYTQTRLSVSGQPWHSSLTLALNNDSIPHRTNLSLHTELQLGDGALELGGSVLSSRRGAALLVQTRLDHSDRLWLQGALEGRCLQTAAGYSDGASLDDDLTIALCLEGRRRLTLEVQRREGVAKWNRLAFFSVRAANQSLTIGVQGCRESLQEAEARVRLLGCHIKNKLLGKIRIVQRLLVEFRHQSRDSVLLQEMSERPLHVTQKAETLLAQGPGGVWGAWRRGPLRRFLTNTVPRCLGTLNRVSLQVQQELKRPLATLAGAYQDVTGRRLDTAWRDGVALWARRLLEILPAVLEEHHQRATKAMLGTVTSILDVVSQQTALWVEARLAAALAGVRRRLASLYKLSHSRCEVTLQVPLPRVTWSDVGEAGLVEFLLEEWLLRPMVALTSIQPTAELYRLKRKMMESPFGYQALVVSDQFAVSFDGHLYELPPRCALLMARDVAHGSFTVLLSPNGVPQHSLLVEMSNITVSIPSDGQVHTNCRVTDKSITDSAVTIRRESSFVEVSNQDGAVVSCDLSHGVCSLTLDNWHHGTSVGLLGTNDNESGNDLTLPDGSQADSEERFIQSWQVRLQCRNDPGKIGSCSNTTNAKLASSPPGCASLFSAANSPLSACFRVVDPLQFLAACDRSRCNHDRAPCRLAAAFVHLCRRNYVPLELPEECVNT